MTKIATKAIGNVFYEARIQTVKSNDMPKLDLEDLDRITVKAMSTFRKMTESKEILLDITEDGEISLKEQPELEKVLKNLDEVAIITQNLKIWAEKNLR